MALNRTHFPPLLISSSPNRATIAATYSIPIESKAGRVYVSAAIFCDEYRLNQAECTVVKGECLLHNTHTH